MLPTDKYLFLAGIKLCDSQHNCEEIGPLKRRFLYHSTEFEIRAGFFRSEREISHYYQFHQDEKEEFSKVSLPVSAMSTDLHPSRPKRCLLSLIIEFRNFQKIGRCNLVPDEISRSKAVICAIIFKLCQRFYKNSRWFAFFYLKTAHLISLVTVSKGNFNRNSSLSKYSGGIIVFP